jgi:disulfide oxidoreductase YuzD
MGNEKIILPILTIYILGFNIPEIEASAIKVELNYIDLVNNKVLEKKSDFVEKLTHDSYIVQVNRIKKNYTTRLEKLLILFEQQNFSDDKQITKEFTHEVDSEEMKLAVDILHYAGTNPDQRKKLEIEQEAWRTINAMFEDKETKLMSVIQEKDILLNEKDDLLNEKNKAMEMMAQELEELKRKLEGKN